jgi:hypothetical protein
MLDNHGEPYSGENGTGAGREAGSRWLKSAPDQVARTPVPAIMPPLVSHVQRQLRHLGEGAGRLARWVMEHGSLARAAARLPVLSRAFDYIRSKAIVDSPVWQRTLDLPWFPGRRLRRRRSTGRIRGVASRQPDISLRPDELHPDELHSDNLLRAPGEDVESQDEYEFVEIYPSAADEAYPMINTELLSPPPILRRPLTITGDSPMAAGDADTPPVDTGKMPDRPYRQGPGELRLFTSRKGPIRTAGEVYPAVTKNLLPSSEAGVRITETKFGRPRPTLASSSTVPPETGRIIDISQVEDGAEGIAPGAEPGSSISPPEMSRPYLAPEADAGQTRGPEERVVRQPLHAYLGQRLSRVLRPLTQKLTLRHRPWEIRPQAAADSIGGSQSADMPDIGEPARPTLPAVPAFPPLASSKQSVPLEPESLIPAPPALKISHASGETLKPTRRPTTPGKPEHAVGHIMEARPPGVSAYQDISETPPGATAPRATSEGVQAGQPETPVGPSLRAAAPKADTIYPTESLNDEGQGPDTRYPVARGYTGTNQVPPGGWINRTLITRISPPAGKYARKQAPELPVASSIVPPVQFGGEPGEDLPSDIYPGIPDMPELAAVRYPNAPELALAPVAGTPKAASRGAGAETQTTEGGEPEGESGAAPDIDAIAEDVYRILKRRLMAERERALGVY